MIKESFIFFIVVLFFGINLISAEVGEEGYSGTLTVSKTSGGKIIISGSGAVPTHYCGNNILETYIGEQCDGSSLGDETCADLGYDLGNLSCKSNCIYDTSSCSMNPVVDTSGNNGGGSSGGGGSGGRGSSSRSSSKCIENWQCTGWGKCKNEIQTRTCTDSNKCFTLVLKPIEKRGCIVEGLSGEEALNTLSDIPQDNQEGFFSKLTGAVVGGGRAKFTIPLVFVVLIVVVGVLVYAKRK